MRDVLLITSCCALEVVGQTPLCCRIGVSPVLKVSVCLVKDKEEDRPLDGTLAVGFSKNLAERKEGQQLKIGGLIVGLVGWFSRFSNSNFFFQFLPPPPLLWEKTREDDRFFVNWVLYPPSDESPTVWGIRDESPTAGDESPTVCHESTKVP